MIILKLLLSSLLLLIPFVVISPTAYDVPELIVEQNCLRATVNPVYVRPIINTQVLGCLAFYESSNNPEAVGDHGKAYGLLQFWETTFDHFCEKYDMILDYENPDHQIRLADQMLSDGYGYHWTTYKFCK